MPQMSAGQIAVEQMQTHTGCGGDEDQGYACDCGDQLVPVGSDLMVAFWDHVATAIDTAIANQP